MEKKVLDYDGFLSESYVGYDASFFNTPGMGNVTSGAVGSVGTFGSGDEDVIKRQPVTGHYKMHERGHHDDSWMRPSGDYTNRNWLVPNYEMFQNQRQSMTRFSIGEAIRCVNPHMRDCFGKMGKIVAFEDQTIRWEEFGSETHVGLTSRQYRCKPQDLEPLK